MFAAEKLLYDLNEVQFYHQPVPDANGYMSRDEGARGTESRGITLRSLFISRWTARLCWWLD